MTYDPAAGAYRVARFPSSREHTTISMWYAIQGTRSPLPLPIEGNKYETDNEYRVAVYYRPPDPEATV